MGERDFSCIKRIKKTVQIPLPATFISNEISGIAEILESWKRQYRKELQGVVVNYKHYSLSSQSGFITPNKPFVYYNVNATFDLFCPRLGDIVKGKINRLSKEHIGCLIEETINATIHLSKDPPPELSPYIYLGCEILFEISYFNYDRKMIRVTGQITPQCIQLMKDLFSPATFDHLVDTPESSNNADEGIGTFSEGTDDGQLNHTFDSNFKIPFSSSTKSKKSKKQKSDSESSSIDTSHLSSPDEKPKKKKKHKDKTNPNKENNLVADNLSSNSVSCDTTIPNFSNFDYSEILNEIKEEELSLEDTAVVKKHKKKRKQDFSSHNEESTHSNSQNSHTDVSVPTADTSAEIEKVKASKKRKRESESSFMEISEQSVVDEMPKKKKKRKDKTIPLLEEEIKNELLDVPFEDNVTATVLSIKEEISSPLKAVNNDFLENKKKKNKDKKSKDKDKSQKKKSKVLGSGSVLKKDKKSCKKVSKKSKLNGEPSKKHKKSEKKKKGSELSKKHKKEKSGKKKKTILKSEKAHDNIKSE